MPNLPGLSSEVYFGDAEKPLPDWRKLPDSEPDDDAPLTPEERKTLVGMLGFDPESADADTHVERFSEGNYSLPGTEIFATGIQRGKPYTHTDLDDMVRNFKANSRGQKPGFRVPSSVVPGGIGHEEEMHYLDRTDQPAAGWISYLESQKKKCPECKGTGKDEAGEQCANCVGTGTAAKLVADFEDISPEFAELLKRKAYREISAEVYDEPPDGMKFDGKALRRAVFLGADIPQLKNLKSPGTPIKNAERFALVNRVSLILRDVKQSKTPGAYWCFSEAKPQRSAMNRDDIIKKLTEHGIDQGTLADVPDEALAEMLRVCEDKDSQTQNNDDETPADPGGGGGDGGGGMDFDDDEEGKDKADPFAEFADDELPEPKDDDEKKDFAEKTRAYAERLRKYCGRAKKYLEKYAGSDNIRGSNQEGQKRAMWAKDPDHPDDYAEPGGSPVTTETAPKKTTVTHQFSEKRQRAMIREEVSRALNGQVKGKMDRFERFTEGQLATQKKATIEAFCESRLKAGKIVPFELDTDNPANLYDRLMRADASRTIRKFREGKKDVALTELDLQMREIDARPARMFSEQVRGAKAGKAGAQEPDLEVEKVEEAFERFSEKFPRGTTKQTIVDGFKIEKKYTPDLTAADFLEALSI